ncbi:MAG: DUF4166 domain-containing protein [Kiloniellaceae bacterium]
MSGLPLYWCVLGADFARLPAVVGDATEAEGLYHFEVSIVLPLIGLVARYHGDLVPEASAA